MLRWSEGDEGRDLKVVLWAVCEKSMVLGLLSVKLDVLRTD